MRKRAMHDSRHECYIISERTRIFHAVGTIDNRDWYNICNSTIVKGLSNRSQEIRDEVPPIDAAVCGGAHPCSSGLPASSFSQSFLVSLLSMVVSCI